MNLNYAIFRSEPIYTLADLGQIGAHNKRDKKSYKSNPDIDLEKTINNIELKPLADKYVKGFYNATKEYKKEHDERMITEREDRKKTFRQAIDGSKNVVADELLFTATNDFFKNMNNDDIKLWADTCMEFVYKDLGYKEEQVLHATIHMDEKTPHIHCVVIPLIKKLDRRTNTDRYTISKKCYIKDKIHLSTLQDMYYKRLLDKGFNLERGIKNSDNEHIDIKEYKKMTRKVTNELNIKNKRLNNAMSNLEDDMKSNKEVLFDKEYVKVKKDTFESINKVIDETKKVMEVQPKIISIYNEVDNYAKSYKTIEKENFGFKKEIKYLENKNSNLERENNRLLSYIEHLLEAIKKFFRQILKVGNKEAQNEACGEIKDYYDRNDFDEHDVFKISKGTNKEDELFEYADIDYLKQHNKSKEDSIEISL